MAWLGRNWRGILFGILGVFLVLFLFDAHFWLVALLAPWATPETVLGWFGLSHAQLASGGVYPPGFDPTDAWRLAERAALGLMLGGSMAALAYRPRRRPLLLLYFVGTLLVLLVAHAVSTGRLTMFSLVFAAIVPGILVVLYPGFPDRLVSVAREGHVSFPLVGFSVLLAIAFAFDIWQNSQRLWHDFGSPGIDIALVLAAALAATRAPGWRILSVLAGLSLAYVGIAAIAMPATAGSWGVVGGSLSVLGGLGLIALTLYESRSPDLAGRSMATTPIVAS